jgi:SAM-dependent methyltransferase
MAYKIQLLDYLNPIEWSQAVWRLEGERPPEDDCDRELIHPVMLAHLPKNGITVDAGCGAGRWPIHLRRLGYRTIGIDISHQAGRLARATDPGLPISVADVRRVPLRDGSVDAVLSLGVVEHDEGGPLPALREIRRILKPGGLVILSVPYNNVFRRALVNRVQTWVTWRRRRAQMRLGFVEYRFTRREMRTFLREVGLEIVSDHPNDYLPPKNVGLWVDWQNVFFNPFVHRSREQIFHVPTPWAPLIGAILRVAPWLICGEVTFVAKRPETMSRVGTEDESQT